jgi:hypothetical protein
MTLVIACGFCPVLAQNAPVQGSPSQDSPDLKVELRSATGSNRFQLGEVVPLELFVSSTTPNRYLEPCMMFWEGCFGYPQCRFVTQWSFDVTPSTGWTDIGFHGCGAMSGPTFDVESSDLTPEPKKYPYTLTTRFRFDTPGKYTVRLSMTIALDDETNKIGRAPDSKVKQNSVTKIAEIVLEIMPAGDTWKEAIIEQGVAAWAAPPLAYTNPPTPEFLKRQQEKDALCNLGTPEAALALVGILSKGIDVTHCLDINSNKDVELTEMSRLLVDPNVGVRPAFFADYAKSLSRGQEKHSPESGVLPREVNTVRDTLFASLPKKTPDAMIVSLETLLRNPMNGYWVVEGSAYDLHEPFPDPIIATAAANFDRLSEQTQAALLDTDWDHFRSPLMLPVVRRKAEAGNGQALLLWLELEPATATVFIRQEVVRPVPRFSSLYLRLPDESLPAQEQQIAANFIALETQQDLVRSATLLHRYATRATLPTVLPFIDQHLSAWSCTIQIPVLAYLLKVSPGEAQPRVKLLLDKKFPPIYCPRGEFLPSIGYMEASPVLDALAAQQLEDGTPLAADATAYLGRYGSAAMKPVVWEQLSRWHKKFKESGVEVRISSQNHTQEDWQLYNLDSRLLEAYEKAQGWTLTAEDVDRLAALTGDQKGHNLSCAFSCGSEASVGPAPGSYYIYGKFKDPVYPPEARIDYLMPTEKFRYSINQYRCPDLKALEQKLLQFPKGSTFSVAHTGSSMDGWGDWRSIGEFLKSHGYSFKN